MMRNIPKAVIPAFIQKNVHGSDVNRVPIDQFNSQSFNIGSNGLPANDITLLMRAQNVREYEVILNRLQEVRVKNPNNKGKTDKQIIGEMMPSWVQTPAEIDKFMNWYNQTHEISFSDSVQTDSVADKPSVVGESSDVSNS